MDTHVSTASERVTQLRKRIAALNAEKREVESKRAKECDTLVHAENRRLELIKELVSADSATEAWANFEIDKLDSLLVTVGRKVSALENSLAANAIELEPFTAELNELQRAIAAEERAETLRVFQSKVERAVREASDTLANARERLADLNRLAAQGIEDYGEQGLRIAGPIVEKFVLGEANLDAHGWKPSFPAYTRLEFWVRSMTRG